MSLPYYFKKKKKTSQNESNEPDMFSKAKPKKQANNQSRLIRKLDRVFSLYIRLRDVMPNGYVRCIACGRIKKFEEVDCGHFHSRTHMSTRYDEDNCHAECRYCNRISADHIIGYSQNLIRKIGQTRFDFLKVKAHSAKHYSDCELEELIKRYTLEVKKLSSLKGIKVNL